MAANPEGIVTIRGKQYQTVAYRVSNFREKYPAHTIETQLIMQDDEKVIMKALIMDGESLIATGYAEEVRAATRINQTSALEVAETSAIGRALAAFGMAGTEYASADEVAAAINQQNQSAFKVKQTKTKVWKALRDAAADEDSLKARETWDELDSDQQKEIWHELSSGQRSTLKKLLAETKDEE